MLSKRNDKVENSSMDNTSKWGNLVSSLRWNHIYSSKLFSNITAYYSQYNYKSYYEYKYVNSNQETTSLSDFKSHINDLSLNTIFQYNCINWLNLELGTNTIYHTYKPNHYQYTDDVTENLPTNTQMENALENALFSEIELKPLSQLTLSAV